MKKNKRYIVEYTEDNPAHEKQFYGCVIIVAIVLILLVLWVS